MHSTDYLPEESELCFDTLGHCSHCEGCGDCMSEIDAFWFGIEREMFLNNITGVLECLIYKIKSYTAFRECENEEKQYQFWYSQKKTRETLLTLKKPKLELLFKNIQRNPHMTLIITNGV